MLGSTEQPPSRSATDGHGSREIQRIPSSPSGRGAGGEGEVARPRVYSLAVRKMPQSGKPQELLNYEEISKDAIISRVKEILKLNLVKSNE